MSVFRIGHSSFNPFGGHPSFSFTKEDLIRLLDEMAISEDGSPPQPGQILTQGVNGSEWLETSQILSEKTNICVTDSGFPENSVYIIATNFIYGGSTTSGSMSSVEFTLSVDSNDTGVTASPYSARVINSSNPTFTTPVGQLVDFTVQQTDNLQTFTIPIESLLLPVTKSIFEIQVVNNSITEVPVTVVGYRVVFG
jgi:hypothetical protein